MLWNILRSRVTSAAPGRTEQKLVEIETRHRRWRRSGKGLGGTKKTSNKKSGETFKDKTKGEGENLTKTLGRRLKL